MKIDLSKLNLNDLKALQKDVAKAIESFEARRRQAAKDAAEAAALAFGYTLADLFGAPGKRKSTAPARYRHPKIPTWTWTGKGRQPKWIKEALAAGMSKDDFLI